MRRTPFFIIISGPTGVGKTDFSLELAHAIGGHIINADMGQCYKPFSIGTAKPAWQSMLTPHYLFDCIEEPKNFSVAEYYHAATEIMQKLWNNNTIPIIVGGSGFYVRSLLFPVVESPKNIVHPSINKDFQADDVTWQALYAIDPLRARHIHPHDTYRIKRALELWRTTGILPSLLKPSYKPIADYTYIWITRDRQELYTRINKRVELMMQEGWMQEAEQLMDTPWQWFLMDKNLLGYPLIFNYLTSNAHSTTFQSLVESIQQETRHYAKRQETFFRSLEKSTKKAVFSGREIGCFEEINLTFMEPHLYIKRLSERVCSRVIK